MNHLGVMFAVIFEREALPDSISSHLFQISAIQIDETLYEITFSPVCFECFYLICVFPSVGKIFLDIIACAITIALIQFFYYIEFFKDSWNTSIFNIIEHFLRKIITIFK